MKISLLYSLGFLVATASTSAGLIAHSEELGSDDYIVREEARSSLLRQLSGASENDLVQIEAELLTLLQEETPKPTRIYTIRMLELFGTKEAVPELALLLKDPDAEVRETARRALISIPFDEATDALLIAMRSSPDTEKVVWIESIAARGTEAGIPALIQFIASGDQELAIASIRALASIGGEEAKSALTDQWTRAEGDIRKEIELALVQGGLSPEMAATLAEEGSNTSIRTAAFRSLLNCDRETALSVLDSAIDAPPSAERSQMLRTVLESDLAGALIARLPSLSPDDQLVILGAISDQRLSSYEQDVLGLLSTENENVRSSAIHTLGFIGGDASLEQLVSISRTDDDNLIATKALARLKATSLDQTLFDVIKNPDDETAQLSAMKLLTLRNPDGVTAVINQLAGQENSLNVRKAAFKSMESVGNIESVKLLLNTVANEDKLRRPAQQSIKKLSVNMGIPAYQWENAYLPALEEANDTDSKAAILAILDAVSCPESTDFLASLVFSESELRPVALKALLRWSEISAGQVWLNLLSAQDITPEEVQMAISGLKRVLTQKSVRGENEDKVKLAIEAIQIGPNREFKEALLAIYEEPASNYKWDTIREIEKSFDQLLDDPDVGLKVQEILDRMSL